MNNFFKFILLFSLGLTVVSCSKSDNDTEPLRDYATQYAKDLQNIETYMNNHYMEVSPDKDVTFGLLDATHTVSIMAQTDYPILTRNVTIRQDDVDITYKIYYIKLSEGVGQSPCNVDRVLTAYKGEYIYDSVDDNDVHTIISEEFETLTNPQTYFNLTGVVRGWSEIFPQLKTGTYTGNPDGTISYDNFGAAVMFIPSGLAYYNGVSGGIPAYSPLIFNVKLYEIQRVDHDGDGIYSYLEDIGGPGGANVPDGYVLTLPEGVANPDDTDGDEIPDYLDNDDDGDFFTTKSETSFIHPLDPAQILRYYPYNGAATDDPATPYVDETKGIPDCSGDFTSPTRKRKYLDPTCH